LNDLKEHPRMNKPITALALAVAAMAAWAQPADGEVRKIDKPQGKITLRHGEIKSLDMPPMTMVFQARDAAQLAGLKNGDRIRFQAVSEGGKYVLTQVEKQP